ncbi:MAG: helix-turn-helix transcriptional regulator [Rhodomicrobium sp.]|nr:helix-turn-helix transcriptional regulator [Rhodomicrobium sp.]
MEEFPAVLDDRLHEAGGAEQLEKIMQNAQRASDFLKALAHETRLLVLCLLAERERSVTELENILSLRQPTVSQQLARLRLDGLVTTRRDGKTIYYSLNDDDIRRVISLIYDLFCHGGNHNRKASALGLEK